MSSRSHLWRLDAVRGFAAFYVFLSHARPLGPVALYQYGQEAVILFFLLSGFVIDYSTFSGGRALVVRTYLIHRVRRIYPLLLVSLLLGYLSACVAAQGWAPPRLFSLVMNLLMFQDVAHLKRGVFANTYYGVTPLWSLAYEWWFYLLFIPMCLRLRTGDAARTVVAGTISAIAFVLYQAWPNQPCLYLSYFIIWWCGVSLAREYRAQRQVTWSVQMPAIAMLALCTLLWCGPVLLALHQHRELRFGVDPVLQLRHFAAALTFLVGGIAWHRARFTGFRPLLGAFARLAPVSYAIYVLHYPLLQMLDAVAAGVHPLLRFAAACAVLLPASYLLEVVLQRRINRWVDRRYGLRANATS